MQKEKVWGIYDTDYVANYNSAFILEPYSKAGADFELSVLRQQISNNAKWLDLGCGTGYFLSQFPGIQRAGYDLSPAMLEEAKRVNPDALFFKQGDFRSDVPEWEGKWSLLTCMWCAYSYVEDLAEVEKVVANMVKWTKDVGDIFIPVVDLEDLRLVNVAYEEPNPVYGGSTYINSCTWTWIEKDTSKVHVQIAPHVEHFVKLLQPYFETVEIIYYPPFQDGWNAKKAVMAKNRLRLPEDTLHLAEIIRHPVPPNSYQAYQSSRLSNLQNCAVKPSALSNRQLFREVYLRIRNGYFFKSLAKKILRK